MDIFETLAEALKQKLVADGILNATRNKHDAAETSKSSDSCIAGKGWVGSLVIKRDLSLSQRIIAFRFKYNLDNATNIKST